jgi:hypothetical protein
MNKILPFLVIVILLLITVFVFIIRKNKPSDKPEVFAVGKEYKYTKDEAEKVCKEYGAEVATSAQLQDAFDKGADWCFTGWVSDSDQAKYPIQNPRDGCAGQPSIVSYNPPASKEDDKIRAGVNCYGVKPPLPRFMSSSEVRDFNSLNQSWKESETECTKDDEEACKNFKKRGVKKAYKKCVNGLIEPTCTLECENCYENIGNTCVLSGCLTDDEDACKDLKNKEGVAKAYKKCVNCKLEDSCTVECDKGYYSNGECIKCEKDEVCKDFLNEKGEYKEGIKSAYKKCFTDTGILASVCTVTCNQGYQLELDNTCRQIPRLTCGPGCETCTGNEICEKCYPGLKLINGECVFNALDPHWTLNETGAACHCSTPGCNNSWGCYYNNPGVSGYNYGATYGCQIDANNLENYYRNVQGLPPIIYGIPAITSKGSSWAKIPYEKVPRDENGNYYLPEELRQLIKDNCRANIICAADGYGNCTNVVFY